MVDGSGETSEKIKQQLNKALVTKAVDALLKYHQKQSESQEKEQLFGNDTTMHVQFDLEVAPVKFNPKPFPLAIPHPIYKISDDPESEGLEEPEVCLIVKDSDKPEIQEMIEKFPEHMGHIKKVLTLTSLRTKHGEMKQRSQLMNRFTMFMVDDSIIPMMMTSLGRSFWTGKKQPIPMRVSRKKTLPFMIRKALCASYITLNTGRHVTAKVGYTGMSTEKLVENCLALADEMAKVVPRGWANIRAIGVKTPKSTFLPFYNKTPAELEELSRLAGLPPVWVEPEELEKKSEADNKEESKRKREQEPKSLLVKALKKQKKLEKESSQDATKDPKDEKKEIPAEKNKRSESKKMRDDDAEPQEKKDTEVGDEFMSEKVVEKEDKQTPKLKGSGEKGKRTRSEDAADNAADATRGKSKEDAKEKETKDSAKKQESESPKQKKSDKKKGKKSHDGVDTSVDTTEVKKDDAKQKETKDDKAHARSPVEKSAREESQSTEAKKSEKKKGKRSHDVIDTGVDTTGEKNDKNDSAKKEVKSSKSPKNKADDSPSSNKKEKESADSKSPQTNTVAKKKEKERVEGKSPQTNTDAKKQNASDDVKEFISADKFTGTKKGYVYKKDKKGLGYYKDAKPVVDKEKMSALLRSLEQKRGRSDDRSRSTDRSGSKGSRSGSKGSRNRSSSKGKR